MERWRGILAGFNWVEWCFDWSGDVAQDSRHGDGVRFCALADLRLERHRNYLSDKNKHEVIGKKYRDLHLTHFTELDY